MKTAAKSSQHWFRAGLLQGMTPYVPSIFAEDVIADIQRQMPPKFANHLRLPQADSEASTPPPYYRSTTEALGRHWRAVGDYIESAYAQEKRRQD